MTKSLFFRLMGAFALVIVLGYSIVYIIANQATANEFHFYMFRGQMVVTQDVANQLADYYRARKSWDGVESILLRDMPSSTGMRGGEMMNSAMMGTPHLWLADARGIIIAATDNSRRGQQAIASELASGTAIRVDGQTIGTLLTDASALNMTMDASSQDFLSQVNRSLLLAGLIATMVALVLGFILFRQITAPLDALTHATQKIAEGDLKARAVVRGEDEISRLGRSFNAMAENLDHSEIARRNMLADVAHELRNPLGVIQSHLEAMLDGVFPTTPEQIASLHDETLLLNRIIDDLRDLALADAGQLSLHRATTDLRSLIERTTESFQAQAAEHQITLRHDLMEDPLALNIDAQRIEQVLRNLISNALRYNSVGARVTTKLARVGNMARIEVTDTGSGIPADTAHRVFERFWRGDKSRALGGSGLGLAIAKQWVEAHGGQIGVTNEMGTGTTFWFTLPL
ncbi:MAG: HAMP domain-containing histidine kinase [Chloroflexi bacterium]|nr:HAMP domain-containing histidine kinase [Chloroflexota bacterium]